MTVQATSDPGAPAPVETVNVTIDTFEIAVPKGTLVIRAAELLGIQIPRFCDHPLLDPIGACRQCLVDVEGQRKPLASCTTVCTEGMVVRTQLSSPVAEKAQRGVMELLLVNHPLDCPMCDKGGECPLQNQAMSNGQGETRFTDQKRTFEKPVAISSEVLLDRERCISCTRCTRFSEEIAGDPFIEFVDRGPKQMIGTAEGEPFNSYFSGNTVQICPVGALTGAPYRFRSRPFDLVSTPSVCEHCAAGCRQRTDSRRGRVTRRLAADDPQVNEEWNCDKGRWAFTYATEPDRLTTPLVRDDEGVLVPASWPEAIRVGAQGVLGARGGRLLADRGTVSDPQDEDVPTALPAGGPRGAAVLTGGRLTLEESYAYSKFARVALGTNDIDMRARPHSAEEARFISSAVAGQGIQVSYEDLEHASTVLLAGLEPEDESPIVLLRLRKAVRRNSTAVFALAPFASRGLVKTSGVLRPRPCPPRARSSWSASGWPRRPARCRPRPGWPRPPGPGWPGSRAGPGSVAPSRPGPCPACSRWGARSPTPGPAPKWPGPGAWPRCRPSPAATPPPSWPRPPPGKWVRGWGPGPPRPTGPTRPRPWPRWTPPRSSSASRCGSVRSPTAPTWSCRSLRWPRRRARSSTGRAAAARSPRRCRCPGSAPSCTCWVRSPTRWTSTSACPTPSRPGPRSPGSAPGGAAARPPRWSRPRFRWPRRPVRPCWPPGTCCWTTGGCRTASPTWPERAAWPAPGCLRVPRLKPGCPTAIRSPWSPSTGHSRCPSM